jgi:peptidoglycan glycosyltransferase
VNRQIAHVAVASLVLLIALVVGTTYWQTWASAGLADRQDNAIQRVAQFSVKRGRILAANGTPLAVNVRKKVGGQTLYFRRYPKGPLFADVVGYSTAARSRTGLEQSYNDFLTGSNSDLDTVFQNAVDKLKGSTIEGNDLVLTVRPDVQALAQRLLRGKCGAAVALDPITGKVFAIVSSPTYDPNLVERHFNRVLRTGGACGSSVLLNRATNGLYTPGSTFKVVTASAALDTGRFTPSRPFDDPGYCIEYGDRVRNAGNPEAPEAFGHVTFFQGLQHSINSVFCNIGKELGAGPILDYAKRYGFYEKPPLGTPADERAASGLYLHHRLYDPKDPSTIDPGRLAFGQEKMLTTPLQMAMVAAGVANGGVVMRPYLVDRIVSPGGKTIVRTQPEKLGRAIKPRIAAELTSMMEAVVTDGTAPLAAIPGIRVAGKTGTAETGASGTPNTTWFIAFAPANAPRVAVAVVLQNQTGSGGTTAAPIAKAIMEALLAGRSNP